MHILLVDDDEAILQLVSIHLTQAGYTVTKASYAEEALTILKTDQEVHLAIVDVMMPGMNGYHLAQLLTHDYDLPVILLTAKGQIGDKELGYQQGIDDYIVKPFETKELLFRVQAILRRYHKATQTQLSLGNVRINPTFSEITIDKQQYIWPMREQEILAFLLQRAERNVNRWELIDEIWGETLDQPEFALNTHINRIRERLKRTGANIEISTIRGVGYKLEVKHE